MDSNHRPASASRYARGRIRPAALQPADIMSALGSDGLEPSTRFRLALCARTDPSCCFAAGGHYECSGLGWTRTIDPLPPRAMREDGSVLLLCSRRTL